MSKQSQELALLKSMMEGIGKHYAGAPQVMFAGVSYAPADLAKTFQGLVDAIDAEVIAKTASRAATLAERDKAKAVGPIVRAFRTYLLATFTNPKDLSDFGLVPRKQRAAVPLASKVQGTAKREATRAARHTMGSRQRKKIKGSVPTPAPGGAPSATGGSSTAVVGGATAKSATSGTP